MYIRKIMGNQVGLEFFGDMWPIIYGTFRKKT